MYKPRNVENIEFIIYFSHENFKGEFFNKLKQCESENMKQLCFIRINTFMANIFFSTCSSKSVVDVDDDYVVDGDDDVGDTDDDDLFYANTMMMMTSLMLVLMSLVMMKCVYIETK